MRPASHAEYLGAEPRQGSQEKPALAISQSGRLPSADLPHPTRRTAVSFAPEPETGRSTEAGNDDEAGSSPVLGAHSEEGAAAQPAPEPAKDTAKLKDWVSPFARRSFQKEEPWHPPAPVYSSQTASPHTSAKPSVEPPAVRPSACMRLERRQQRC